MRRNNKGFSLVELIVALAIFAIAGVAVFGFMVNSSRLYQRTNVEVKLQYEQQLAVNQIRDMVVESDRGIYFDEASKTLALYGAAKQEGASTVYPVTVIKYVQSEQKIYYGIKNFATLADVKFVDVETKKLLAENVKEFKVDLTKVKNDKVLFDVTFIVGDKEQTAKETVALRNRLVVSNEVDTIWGDVPEIVDSFIRDITICRGAKSFANGEQDEIGKCGEAVVVAYSAKIVATEDSDREYKVTWSIDREIEGVGVNADGEVTVAHSVPSSTTFKLTATSVDDPGKYAYINIVVTDSGIYPESMTLTLGDVTDGNGFRTYKLVPTLIYSNGSPSSDYNLFMWDGVDALPGGGTFDEETGVLTLGPGANGKSVKVKAIAKERKADGTVLFAEYTITVDGISEYVPGPTAKIAALKTLSRGGFVFPTMIFENATHSNYTYTWKIEPYYDEETAKFDAGGKNDSFNLVSIAESGGYNSWNVKHELTTGTSVRAVTLGCAAYLNWNETFKVKVSGTAIDVSNSDTKGDVLTAAPIVVTIKPVSLSIERYGGTDVEANDARPVLTNSEIMFEDWYWDKKEPGTENAIWSYSRRWFFIYPENVYIHASNQQNTTLEHHFIFKDVNGILLSNVGAPDKMYQNTKMMCGFKKQMMGWYRDTTPRPAFLSYYITYKDNYGNSISSNVEDFSIVYDYYYPEGYNGEK